MKINENLRKFAKIHENKFTRVYANSRKFAKIHENRENIYANIGTVRM